MRWASVFSLSLASHLPSPRERLKIQERVWRFGWKRYQRVQEGMGPRGSTRLTLARTPLPASLEGGKLGRRAGKVSSQVSPEIGECRE